jgi:hypothetical protein
MYGEGLVKLPTWEELTPDTKQTCEQFLTYHIDKCVQDIVRDRRYLRLVFCYLLVDVPTICRLIFHIFVSVFSLDGEWSRILKYSVEMNWLTG